MINIIGFNGEAFKEGVVAKLLREALHAAQIEGMVHEQEIKTELVHLSDVITTHHDGRPTSLPHTLDDLFDRIEKADGFIFATPVYWYMCSDLMHTLISYLTALEMSGFLLEGKVVGMIAHCNDDGGMQAALSMAAPLNQMGCRIPPYCFFYKNKTMAQKSERRWMMKDHKLVGKNVLRMIVQDCRQRVPHWG